MRPSKQTSCALVTVRSEEYKTIQDPTTVSIPRTLHCTPIPLARSWFTYVLRRKVCASHVPQQEDRSLTFCQMQHHPDHAMRSPAGPRIDASQATPAVGLDSGQAPVWKGIDTLPNELLLKIFANVDGEAYVLSDEFIHAYAAQVNTHQDDDASELHDDVRDYGDTRLLLPAMATCKQWRDVIVGTPTLWRRIVVYNNLHWLETCLERSRKLTVQVKFRHSTMNLSRAWKAIQPQKDRIAKLHFRWFECAQSGDLALEEMGQLTSLLVEVFHDEATTHNEVCSSLLLTPFPRLETSLDASQTCLQGMRWPFLQAHRLPESAGSMRLAGQTRCLRVCLG